MTVETQQITPTELRITSIKVPFLEVLDLVSKVFAAALLLAATAGLTWLGIRLMMFGGQ